MEEIRRAQQRGLKIYGETCPQYLVLTAKDLEGLNMEGAKYVCSPPPRDKASQAGLLGGACSSTCSRCSRRTTARSATTIRRASSRRAAARRSAGCRTAFRASRRGCRSCFPRASARAALTLNEFVALTATNHAKTYGLYPKKGTIAVGSDADIAIWDPERELTISQSLLHHGSDYTPYEGIKVKGWPVSTMVRGQIRGARRRAGRQARRRRVCVARKSPLAKPAARALGSSNGFYSELAAGAAIVSAPLTQCAGAVGREHYQVRALAFSSEQSKSAWMARATSAGHDLVERECAINHYRQGLVAPTAFSISVSSPFNRSIGFGGQPGMTRSTGTTEATPPTVA